MSARYPDLSIVMPAYSTGRALDLSLRALASTEPGPGTFEVIVVDDGSKESLRPVVDAYQQIPVSFMRLARNSGRAAARNIGASQARGKRLLFLDGDSIPLKGLINGHVTFGVDDHEGRVLLGSRINPGWGLLAEAVASGEAGRAVAAHEDDFRHLGGGEATAVDFMRHRAPWLYCYTLNLSVPRNTFTELNGFDEAFTGWGFEDTEFGYRFFESRHRDGGFDYRPDIACMHLPHFRNPRVTGRESKQSIRYMKRKHPNFDMELVGTDVNPRVESKIRYYEAMLAGVRPAGLGLSAPDVLRLLPDVGSQKVLWIGAGLEIDAADTWQLDHARTAGRHNLHLLGVETPFSEQEFDVVINVDLWRFLTPEDLSYAIIEGLRVGQRLLLVASSHVRYSGAGLGMADLDYFAEAYGSPHRLHTVEAGPEARVMQVSSA